MKNTGNTTEPTPNTRLLSLDPSGNFDEGKGSTGWCAGTDKNIEAAGIIRATDYPTQMRYWEAVITKIHEYTSQGYDVVCEDYRLYAASAKAQINSNLETPQLIGVIKYYCYTHNVKLHLEMAIEVKHRWSNEILVEYGYISKLGHSYVTPHGIKVGSHSLDALRHYYHYQHFKRKEKEKDAPRRNSSGKQFADYSK